MRVLLLLLVWCSCSLATETEPTATEAPLLDEVVVSGVLPGPGLWKVSHGDHVMWILGTLQPLPRTMQWDSTGVQARIAQSQELVLLPSARVKTNVGLIGGMLLVPKALSARRNPDKESLREVVGAELYARWQPLQQRYLKRNRAVEKQRPIMAAHKLYERVLYRNGLKEGDVVVPTLRKLAKRAGLTITVPMVELEVEDPRAALNEFAASGLDDLPCFAQTLDRLEQDLGAMKARANAWAVGDLQTLGGLPYVDQRRACTDAVLNAQVARKRGFGEVREQARQTWLEAASGALERNRSSFAVLQIDELLRSGGLADALRERGYQVEAPEATQGL